MAITVNKEGPYYATAGSPITFSSLRTNFKESSSGKISASEFIRNTSVNESNPIIPDATENANIVTTTANGVTLSQFRNSIKKYIITQTDVDTNFDIDAQDWNSNLGKNVKKIFKVTGVIGATSTENDAATLGADICNFELDVSGNILGAGGITAGSIGGNSLYVSNTTQRTVNNKIKININANGKIYSGGDAGTNGSAGNANSIACNSSSSNNYFKYNTDYGATSSCSAPACDSGDADSGCGGYPGNESDKCRNASRRCYRVWQRLCKKTTTTSGNVTSNGGNAGTFGVGRGYNNQETSLAGNKGNNATEVTCNNTGSKTTGNNGTDGNAGKEWGSAKAIRGNLYNITGGTINTVKGTT